MTRATVAAALLLFAAAWSNSLGNAFQFDDAHVIQNNLFVRDLVNVPRFFTDATTFSTVPQNATYRPLVSLSLALDHAIGGGLHPVAFHVTQLLLFAALGALVFLLYRELLPTPNSQLPTPNSQLPTPNSQALALFAATLYCIHTGNTQVGNYISARSELLSALGVVGSFVLYLTSPVARRYFVYMVPAALGMFAKNHAAMFAPLLLSYKLLIEQQLSLREVLARRRSPARTRALLSSLPAFVVMIGLLVFVESMNGPGQHWGGTDRWMYLATSAWVWVRYLALYGLPVGLSADTDLALFDSALDPRVFVGIAFLLATLAVAWVASRSREQRPIAFGILWFWIAIAPTSTVVPLGEVTNDHRYFIGFIGLNLAVVTAISIIASRRAPVIPSATREEPRRKARGFSSSSTDDDIVGQSARRVLPILACAVLLAHAAGTFLRNRVWRNDETLWADVARKSPRNGRGLMNYGVALYQRGRHAEARDLFLRARELLPRYAYVETNLGLVSAALNDSAAAEAHFRRGVELAASEPVVHRFYARWLLEHGRGFEALRHQQVLVGLAPGDADARRTLMAFYAALGETAALQRLARETHAALPADSVAAAYARGGTPFTPDERSAAGWTRLGDSLARSSRPLDAAVAYRTAHATDSSRLEAVVGLASALERLGFYKDALDVARRARSIGPGDARSRVLEARLAQQVSLGRGLRLVPR